jgi:CopA family copper-resistance protein
VAATVEDRLMWGNMRMAPTDIMDVTGATYTFLMNGRPPAANWTALFAPGENVRLRFINGSSMTTFDVRIPGLDMRVVQADGSDVAPVVVEEFRIGVAETYDVIVQPREDRAFTIFVQPQDRSGYGRATLAPRAGMVAAVPPLDPRPMRSMADMGMDHGAMGGMNHGGMDHSSVPGMSHGTGGAMNQGAMNHGAMNHGAMSGMDHASMSGTNHGSRGGAGPSSGIRKLEGTVGVDNIAMMTRDRLAEAGGGLEGNGRRSLRYADLRALAAAEDRRPPSRDITLHLTGNMHRFIWGFDGKKFSEAAPIELQRGERVRFVLINDTMMEHPIHLHGMFSELENDHGDYRPFKHTLTVKPAERLSFLVTAVPGRWAFHCHLLYHMEAGMFREVRVA